MSVVESKEVIKARMLEQAAGMWGRADGNADALSFDPLVDLLTGACASELEKISHEIQATRSRVMERLVGLLMPDVHAGALPSHAIISASPVEPVSFTQPENQLLFRKTSGEGNKELYFSPAGSFKLFDGKVSYTAFGNKVHQHNGHLSKEPLLISSTLAELPPGVFWLGLELHDEIRFPEGLTFYFDWKNEPEKHRLLQMLPLATWQLQGVELVTSTGIHHHTMKEESGSNLSSFNRDFDVTVQAEELAQAYYAPHFITLHHPKKGGAINLRACKKSFPEDFKAVFQADELKVFKKEIIWFRIQFPEIFTARSPEPPECAINCFPALNRRLHTYTQKLQESLNMLPLQSDGFFMDIASVEMDNGQSLACITGGNPLAGEEDVCYLRRNGVERQGASAASEALQHLLELVRSEGAALAAQGQDMLQGQLTELNQLLLRLAKNIRQESKPIEETPFLFVHAKQKGQSLEANFWSTEAAFANRLPPGTPLETGASVEFVKNSACLISSTTGGRNPKREIDRMMAFREALVARGRTVTAEDISSLCRSRLGSDLVKNVEVKKGIVTGVYPHQGLQRIIRVILTPRNLLHPSPEEWQSLAREIQVLLEKNASPVLPFQVEINYES